MDEPLPPLPADSWVNPEQISDGTYRLRFDVPQKRAERWFPAAFLGFWLCGWAAGEASVATALVGMLFGAWPMPGPMGWIAPLFLLGWLGGWTVGGVAAMCALYRLVGPRRPESVTLGYDEL